MADLLSVPLKKPSDVDIVKPLKNVISTSYSQSDKSQVYIEAINELNKLRTTAIWKVFEKYESSLDLIYSYYDQLSSLESKIPSNEVQIPFKWKDAFDKGSIFGGRISLTVSSISYEKVCLLFNIAALQSSVASTQNLHGDEGLKLAAKLFQQAAGIFNYLKGNVMAAIQQEPTPDLNPDTLGALTSLMIAQAQEIFVLKAIHDQMKDAIIAKLCSQCEELYADALKLFQKEFLRNLWDKEWIPIVAGKQAAYHGLTEYFQSLVCKSNKMIGEEICRLERSVELLKASQQRSNRATYFQDWLNKAERNLTEAKKDNDFIYHERIPDWKNLNPVGRALIAKQLPIPERFSTPFKDLFENLVPVAIHQAMASYDVRKNEIVNTEIARLRESTQLLNSLLASLNLPAALEETSGTALPQSLVEKSEAVQAAGGLVALEAMAKELPELLQRNKEILDEAEKMLNEEQASDQQLRQQFGPRWNRTPSEKLTETFRTNAAKYRQIINNAMNADNVVQNKFATHRRGMELLSQGKDAMESAVPACGNAGSSALRQGSSFKELSKLMEEVETIKAERDVIESELKSATTDMQATFLNALTQDGGVNEPALSMDSLHRVYGALQKQVADSLAKQERIISQIQEQNSEFCKEKSGAGSANEREAELKVLASAHDAFTELQSNLKEGAKFYNDLTQLLVIFQNKISDFCFARKTEKEELLKDLTQEPTRQNFEMPSPTSPTSQDSKKPAPPRPPPPQSQLSTTNPPPMAASGAATAPGAPPAGLPYPMYPSGMPMPYGAAPAAPYPSYAPPPMPGGYNPYSAPPGAPYPHQPGYQYPFPQVPYGTYPGTYPGAAHGQQRPW